MGNRSKFGLSPPATWSRAKTEQAQIALSEWSYDEQKDSVRLFYLETLAS
jgi:hypothetical protein